MDYNLKKITYLDRQWDEVEYDKETEYIFISISKILYNEYKKTISEWDSIYIDWIFSKILSIKDWKFWKVTIVRTNKEEIIKEYITVDSFMSLKPATHTINILDFIWRYEKKYKGGQELCFNKTFSLWINNDGRISLDNGVLLRYIYKFVYEQYK